MDWPLIGLTASLSWFALLLAEDIAALVKLSRKQLSRARNIAFVATLAGVVGLGYAFAGENHSAPCPIRVNPH